MEWFFNYPYLRWHIIFVFLPSILLWAFNWRYLIRYRRTIIAISSASLLWGWVFDFIASPVLKLWFYNHNFNQYFLGLPLEEYLFLLFVPQGLAVTFILIRKKLHG
jgi:hypothetical protein